MPAAYRHRFSPARMDPEALVAWLSLRERAGLADDLSSLMVPCLLLVGENDEAYAGAVRSAEAMTEATCVTIPRADHLESIALTDLVLTQIRGFLVEVTTAQTSQEGGA